MKHRRRCRQLVSAILICLMVLSNFSGAFAVYAENGNEHVHTEECYAQEGALLCTLPESEEHIHSEDCYCPGGEYICGQVESEGHVHDESCYEDDEENENASPSNASSPKLICGEEESEGHTHTETCICPGGELICGLEESAGHTHGEDCYAKGGELICGLEETDSQDESKYSYIKDLFEADESIAYDAATQSIVVIDVSAAQSQFLQKLNIENAEQYIHEYDEYWFQIAINGDLLGEDYPYYYISNEDHTLEARRTAKKNNTHTWWSGVALETNDNTNGVIALVVDKSAEYKVSAPMEKWYMTNYTPVEPHEYTGNYGFVMNPLSYEDAFGYSGTADGDFTEISFHYEWDLINDIIGDITVANPDMKSIDNAGYADIDTEVTLKVEIRDAEGNISLLPKRCYHVYSFWDYLQYMSEDGIIKVKTTSDDDGENKYGRFDFFIPIGYDYRITVMDYGAGLKDYAYAYNWNQEYANDDDGFCTVEKDLNGDGWGTDEEFLFMPKTKEIRIEKVVEGADVSKDEKFRFRASHIVPVTKYDNSSAGLPQPDKTNVLSNYYYELFDSKTDEPVPSDTPYKTDNDGCFELSVGQYAIFKTWVTPSDIADYEDFSCGFEDIVASGSMRTETRYIFEELSQGEYSTTITHLSNGTEAKIDGKVADHVVGGDSLLYHNVFASAPAQGGSLTISKKVDGTGTPDKNTEFEFAVTQNGNPVSGQYSVNGGAEQPIPADGKIKLKADESAVLTGLEPGEYVVTETTPSQTNYKSTAFSVNGGTIQDGTSATVTVIASSEGENHAPVAVTFTNTYEDTNTPTPPTPDAKTGNLTVSKTVAGNAGDTTKTFTFTVSLSDKSINGTYGEMTFVNGVATFTLKHGEQKTASALPAGIEFSVTEDEANQNGYTTTSTGASGTILNGKTSVAAFTNTKSNSGGHHGGDSDKDNKYGNLTVSKTVAGTAGNVSQQFTFTVTLNQAITGKYGDMNFDKGIATVTLKHGESITAKNLPANITYNVVETEANQHGYTTTSTGASGTILNGKTSVAAFTNTKNNGGGHSGGSSDDNDHYGSLMVSKTVTGTAGNADQQFTFTVTLSRSLSGKYGDMNFDKGIATVTLKHGESVTAKNLPANITYNVVETEANQDGYTTTSTGANGTILDGKTSVAAFTNHKDSISPDNQKHPTSEQPSTGDTPTAPTIPESSGTQTNLDSVPQTGDNQNPALWFILMGLSMIGLIASVCAIRNNRNR